MFRHTRNGLQKVRVKADQLAQAETEYYTLDNEERATLSDEVSE